MRKCITKLALLLSFLTLLSHEMIWAQTITIGTQPFTANVYGPVVSSITQDTFYSRHAYIYPEASLGGLQHGDTIRSLSFFKTSFGEFTAGSKCVIYIANTTSADYPAGRLHWENDTLTVSTQKVFDGDLSFVSDNPGFQRFDFNVKDFYVFDTTYGHNLKILIGFNQTNRQTVSHNWAYENNVSVLGFVSNNETKYQSGAGNPPDSLNGSNVRKPTLRIHLPRERNLEINKVYALGRMPILMDRPDSIQMLITNSGRLDLSQVKVEITVSGANTFSDTVSFGGIKAFESKNVAYGDYFPSRQGAETITARIIGDSFRRDDTASIRRLVNYNVYGHADPFINNAPGGIGFNGGVSGDFVAKFYCKDTLYMNQVKVDFGFGGAEYLLGLWAADTNGNPGVNLFTSDTLTATNGTNIIPVLPRVKIDTAFFVGIRQINQFAGFAYQVERPIRPNAFYFTSPSGNATWTPFHPGFDFNVNIQPRIQVANDVGIVSIDLPENNDSINYNKTGFMNPKATVINYGFRDQNIPFDVVCEITDNFGQTLYKDTKLVTVKSNDTAQVQFKDFSLANLGRLKTRVYTILNTDNVTDNDTVIHDFDIVIRHDVSVERFFDPVNGSSVAMNRDTIWPVLRVVNSGVIAKNNVNFTLNVVKDDIIYHTQTKQVDIDARGSLITTFDSFVIPVDGQVTLEAYLWGVADSFPNNDTLRISLNVQRTHDILVRRIQRPENESIQERGAQLFPLVEVRNQGIENMDSIRFTIEIREESGKVIYTDASVRDVARISTAQASFRKLTLPDSNARYEVLVIAFDDEDQDPTNDTLSSYFLVRSKVDLALIEQITPDSNALVLSGQSVHGEIVSQANGIDPVNTSLTYYWSVQGPNGYSQMDSIVRDYTTDVLTFEEKDTLRFGSFSPSDLGDYKYEFYTNLKDGESGNDTLHGQFTVSVSKSITLVEIVKPLGQIYQAYLDNIRTEIILKNTGLNDLAQGGTAEVNIINDGQSVYTSTWSFDALTQGEVLNASDIKEFTPTKRGDYQLVVNIAQAEDQIGTDNSDTVYFTVAKDKDIQAANIVFPAKDEQLNFSDVYAPRANFKNDGDLPLIDSIDVEFQVWKDGGLRYQNAKRIWLDSAETEEVVFDSSFVPNGLRTFTAIAFVKPGTDLITRNDTVSHEFSVDYGLAAPQFEMQNISVYPNPGSQTLTVQAERKLDVVLFNSLGQEVLRSEASKKHELNTAHLAPGSYTIRASNGNGSQSIQWVKL